MLLRIGRSLTLLVWILALGFAPLHAQSTGGIISGTATDDSGAVLPGVTVLITNSDTAAARTLVTDGKGRYAAPDLPPGRYSVKATLDGFSGVLATAITLEVGRETIVNLSLKIGKVSEEVEVVGESKLVNTTSASTGGLITTGQIEGLPLNGRSFVELATLTPGVQLTQSGGQSTSTGFGAKLSVNGSRYTANLFTLDGTNLNDQYSQAGSASGNVLGVEAVREFQVLTNSFSAEYGHHTGGIVNAATKSGTNDLHGPSSNSIGTTRSTPGTTSTPRSRRSRVTSSATRSVGPSSTTARSSSPPTRDCASVSVRRGSTPFRPPTCAPLRSPRSGRTSIPIRCRTMASSSARRAGSTGASPSARPTSTTSWAGSIISSVTTASCSCATRSTTRNWKTRAD